MLQISEIVKKTVGMFDLFNEHFYHNELTRPVITVSPDGGCTAGAVSMKSGTPTMRNIERLTSVPNISTTPSSSWPPRSYMKWLTSAIWNTTYRM